MFHVDFDSIRIAAGIDSLWQASDGNLTQRLTLFLSVLPLIMAKYHPRNGAFWTSEHSKI